MSLRTAQKQLTRQLLLESGLKAFAQNGYDAATIDDIVAAAGANRTTFYLHFASKALLVQALIEEINDKIISIDVPRLSDVIAAGERDGIRGFLARRFDQWPEIMPYITVANQAAYADEAIAEAVDRWHESATSEIVEGLARADRFDPATRPARARAAFGQLEYFSRRWAHEGWTGGVTRDDALFVLCESWVHLLAGRD